MRTADRDSGGRGRRKRKEGRKEGKGAVVDAVNAVVMRTED